MNNNYQNKPVYDFRGKHPDEDVILMLRRHWFVAVIYFSPAILFLLVIVIIQAVVGGTSMIETFPLGKGGFYLMQTILLMFWWLAMAIIWVNYYLDVWIVTTKRIINIEQIALFRREISELEHGKIQDVTTEVLGFFPTLLRYGNVHIQTAATLNRFIFKEVPSPAFVRDVIMKLQQKATDEQMRREGQILRGKL
ncbi:MAG TPA: hypothetical protein GX706_01085 [Candidatus Moranbacteria bacterium]|nr:hypothetical protein [Candidatus Moranbacteria bacterium]